MNRLPLLRSLGACAVLALPLLAGAHAGHAAASTTVSETVMAGPYKLTLDIGPLEVMYTAAQIKKLHPKSGEIMISGTMVMGMGMGPMPNHHLELHVFSRQTGAVVTKAMVAITIYTAKGKLVEKVPIAVMRGIKSGASDTHFGNNVALKDGKYMVKAQVEHTTATFMVTVGAGSMGGMSM
jgi:hypothetical protein